MIDLVAEDWRLTIAPQVGASISRLTWRGFDILRPAPEGSSDVLQAGCFPLMPYANRIAGGRFMFGGREIVLPPLSQFAPHAIHGHGWLAEWSLSEQSQTLAVLNYRHDGDSWPWPYEATQTFILSDRGLKIELAMKNLGDEPMPAGLGLHPYFPITSETRLLLISSEVWGLLDDEIPGGIVPVEQVFDWRNGPRVGEAPFVDHCYVDWGGTAHLQEPDRTVTITASSNAGWAQIYAPGETFCCLEPVTHRPDAVHGREGEISGLTILAPDAVLSMSMDITAASRT